MIYETFSKRQKKLSGSRHDFFTYDSLPHPFRVQVCHIWEECIGKPLLPSRQVNPAYKFLQITIAKEFGLFHLRPSLSDGDAIRSYFCDEASVEEALDMIDIVFGVVSVQQKDWTWFQLFDITLPASAAINDLNKRFLEHGLGFAFLRGDSPGLIRKDNEHLHQEIVKPALRLLQERVFEGANAEYRSAHEHYRHARHKECLNDCLKAFESTMKAICTNQKWAFDPTATAKTLIGVCFTNGLLPKSLENHFANIRSALESSIPTVRNKLAAHGQGVTPVEVPGFYAEYLLHETAVSIVFLVDAWKELKR